METEFCLECEEPMTLILNPDGETFFSCQQCSELRDRDDREDLVSTAPSVGFSYAFGGEGAKPTGYKYEQFRISESRRQGKHNLHLICQQFGVEKLKKEMEALFEKIKHRHLDVSVGAVFLSVVRHHMRHNPGEGRQITMRQVSSFLGISVPKIARCLKYVDRCLETSDHPTNGAITRAESIVGSVLPQVELYDPLMPNEIITSRVQKLTEKIIQLFQRYSAKNMDPYVLTNSAGLMAWKSCFYYNQTHHGHVPHELVKIPTKPGTIAEYLTLIQVTFNKEMIISFERGYGVICGEFAKLLEKMPWVQLRAKKSARTLVPEYLEQIIQYQEMTCNVLNAEAEKKQRNDPIVKPVVPRELTAEEKAELDSPELSEKDLPDSELANYLRSTKEVDSLKALMDPSDWE